MVAPIARQGSKKTFKVLNNFMKIPVKYLKL